MTPEQLLFTDKQGARASLDDVIDDGLEGGYEDRLSALVALLSGGAAQHRLLAAVMLVSWGAPAGLAALLRWAEHPGEAPWSDAPVSADRLSGADDSFARLAEALGTSRLMTVPPAVTAQRHQVSRALLRRYHELFFGRKLAEALGADPALAEACRAEVAAAAHAAVAALGAGSTAVPDLGVQAAALLAPLARLDDADAAAVAQALLSRQPTARVQREVAAALRAGEGPATHTVLTQLNDNPDPSVSGEARTALAIRARR